MNGILTLLLSGVLCASADAADTAPVTELGKAAASMRTGEWKELKTSGYSQGLVWAKYQGELAKFNHGADSIFNYCNSVAWAPRTRKVFFVGLGHYAALKFITYSADTNEWTLMPVPPWADPRKLKEGHWPRGHAYCKNDVDTARRQFLFGFNTRLIYRYDIEKGEWIDPIPVGRGMPTFKDANSGIRVFPELGGIVRFWHGRIDLYEPEKKAWKLLGNHPGVGMHGLAAYSAKAKVLVFGGGDVKDTAPVLYRLDATGKTTRLKPLPFPQMHVQGTIFTADPVTGEFLAGEFRGKGPRTMYALDALKDEWKELPATLPEGKWLVATAVPNYGVTMVCTATPAKVWLYKHQSPWGEASTKPGTTAPRMRQEASLAAETKVSAAAVPAAASAPGQPTERATATQPSSSVWSGPAPEPFTVVVGPGRYCPVVVTTNGTLVMVKGIGRVGADGLQQNVGAVRSTDGGRTWGDPVPITTDGNGFDSRADPRRTHTYSQVLVDRDSGIVWLLQHGRTSGHEHRVRLRRGCPEAWLAGPLHALHV